MAEDAETKKIARLDFGIDTALSSLDKIDTKLKTISESSEKYAKKIGQSLSSGIDKKVIDNNIKNVQKSYDGLSRYEKNRAADVAAYKEKQEIKTTEMLKRENAKQQKSVQTLYDKITNYANTYLIYQGFNALKRGVKETIDEMVKVEQQMVAIDRVMNIAGMNIDKFRDKLIQMASDYGNSFNNVADISLRLAQAGFKEQENLALTEKTLLALNTAELNATQATDDMVAVMAQWGLMTGNATEEAQQYGAIIDKINKVADNFPTTSADLMDALKKTSSAFNLAGASIDETIALITAAEKASQRGGKVIGTALSNITQQLKDEKRLDIAESLGLNFFTDETKTQFKDIVEIFAEMSQKMQQLKDAGKENSTEMQQLLSIFTVFRRNIGASLLGEMSGEDSTYLKALETSINSVGYSLQENEKYLRTAKAAQEQFNAELLKLKTQIWEGGLENVYRGMLETGNDLIQGLSKLIDKFGLIPTAIGAITAAYTVLNNKVKIQDIIALTKRVSAINKAIEETGTSLKADNKLLEGTSQSFKKYVTSVDNGKVSLRGYSKELVTSSIKTAALTAATIALNAAISIGLSLAITAIVSAINDWIHAEEKAIEKNNELKQKAQDSANELKEQVNSIQNLTKEYKEFSKTIQDSKDKNKLIDPENVNKAYELQTKINDAIKDSGRQVQLVAETTDEYGEKIKTVNTQYEQQLNLLRTIAFEKKQEEARELKTAMEAAKRNIKGVNVGFGEYAFGDFWGNKKNQMKDAGIDFSGQFLKDVNDTMDGFELDSAGFKEIEFLSPEKQIKYLREWNQQLEEASKQGKEVGEAQDYVREKLSEVEQQYKTLEEAQEAYKNSLSELYALSGQVDVYDTILQSIADSYENIEGPNKLIDDIQAINEKFREGEMTTKEYFDNLQEQIKNINLSENLNPEELEAYQAIFAATTETMAEGIEQLISGLESGVMNFADYSSGIKEAAENTLDLYVKQNELQNIDGVWKNAAGAVDEYANSLQGALNGMNEMADLMPVIADNYDYIAQHANEAGEAAFKQSDVASQAYQDLANNVAISLNKMRNDNNQAYQSIVNDVFAATKSMTNEEKQANNWINQALLSDANALNAALNSSAQQLAASTNRVTNSMGNVLSALGNAISGFNYKITATPRITGSFGLSKDANGIPNGIKLPSFGFDITGEGGSSLKGLGSALNTFGSDLKDYASSSFKYTTLKSSVGNYTSSGSPSIGSSGGYSGGGSSGGSSGGSRSGSSGGSRSTSSEEDEAYKNRLNAFISTLEKMESKEEDWVKKQKQLGLLSNSDMLYITQQRIRTYTEYLDTIKKATWINVEDREKLENEYTKKLKESQLDYFDYLKDKLNDEVKAIEEAKNKKIKALEEETDKKIALLKKEKEAEDTVKERKEILDEISYWEQRTGREAVENLAKAREKLAEFDKNLQIETQIEALEENEKNQKESLERQAQNEIDALQRTYDAKVKAFSEADQIIYDNSVISATNLYNAYNENFVIPLSRELEELNKITGTPPTSSTTPSANSIQSKSVSELATEVIRGVYGNGAARKKALGDRYNEVQAEVNRRYRTGKFHKGGKVGGNVEAFALLKPNEVILKPEWANSLERMMKYFDNVTQGKVNGISNSSVIEVEGNLVNIQANVRNQSDIDSIGQKVEKILKDKFNIKK